MCTLGIGAKTVFTRERLATFSRTHGPENDFAVEVINRIIGYGEKQGWGGMRMYDPTAVAAALDSTLVETEFWHVDVETQGHIRGAKRWQIALMPLKDVCGAATDTSSKASIRCSRMCTWL
jgi:inosine-uridine nucleoside N-ribohydrolase